MNKKFEYKWVMAGLCTLMVLAGLGFCNSAKSLYVDPVSKFYDVERAVFSLNDTIRYLSTAAANIFFGKLILKFGTKKLICAGFIAIILANIIFAVAPIIPVFFIGSFLLGVGIAFTTTTMVGTVINRWFTQNNGAVTGFALAASGIGGAIATQILAPFIFESASGFKKSYLVCALVVAVAAVLVLVFFKEKPLEGKAPVKKSRNFSWQGLEFSEAVKKPYFYSAVVFVFLSGLALQGMSGSAATHIKDVGIDGDYTALVLSVHLFALAFSKFLTGFLYDKFGLRCTVCITAAAGIFVMLLLTFVENTFTGRILSMIYGVISALALPMETVLIPLYASDLLGQRSFDKAMGIFAGVNTAGFALGAPIINSFYDAFGSYKYGFILFAVIMIIVLVGFQFVITQAHKERAKDGL